MADFELHINYAAFERAGRQPRFDENLFGDLLDEQTKFIGVPEDKDSLDVYLKPYPPWKKIFVDG